jgi:hypothetical protein
MFRLERIIKCRVPGKQNFDPRFKRPGEKREKKLCSQLRRTERQMRLAVATL